MISTCSSDEMKRDKLLTMFYECRIPPSLQDANVNVVRLLVRRGWPTPVKTVFLQLSNMRIFIFIKKSFLY